MATIRTSASASPEFEFWMVRNPSFPQPNLVSADELFVDGILLPLKSLHLQNQTPKLDPPDPHNPPELPSHQVPPATTTGGSKRWTDIFKKASSPPSKEDDKLEKKKERKSQSQTTATSAELNINIWPFSRSRSAGNSGARPRMFPGTRKVNSAPCSRSNSAGDSKSRKWPSSPGRPGVHLGRSSPVWQVRRGGSGSATKSSSSTYSDHQFTSKKESRRTAAAGMNSKNTTTQVVNLNGPMCVGYRQHLSCRSDVAASGGGGGSSSSGNVGSGGSSLFNIRSLFSKKVY